MCATADDWRPNTPAVVLEGCFLYPELAGLWRSFERLSRGRMLNFMGQPLPLQYRDVRDEAARSRCKLPSDTVEDLLTLLDDVFLQAVQRDNHRTRDDKQHGRADRGGAVQ